MSDLVAGNLIKDTPTLSTTDRVGRAISLLHRHSLPALAVLQGDRPVGLFTEEALLPHAENPGDTDWEALAAQPVENAMRPLPVVVHERTPLSQVAQLFRSYDFIALPVVDDFGRYRGVISRRDVVAALCHIVHPGTLAGMATPLGVYLTNGVVRAGAGDLGLFLTGVFLAALWAVAASLVSAFAWAVQHYTSLPLLALRDGLETAPGALYFGSPTLWLALFFFAQLAAFFLFMHFLPLAGTHGAEHQVVHTLEKGEELTPEAVLSHTTVHPRCGTNLAAMMMILGVGIFYFATARITDPSSLIVDMFLVVLAALLLRQRIGGLLQRLITTRRPSPAQVNAAIAVGKQLLERCRLHQGRQAGFLQRFWNMGLIQVLSGAVATSYLLQLIQQYLGRPLL